MLTKVSVLVPTRGRVERLRKLIESFEQTHNGVAQMVFRVDEDDPDTRDYLFERCFPQALSPYRVVVGPRLEGYRSLPRFFNQMLSVATGDVLMCGNDDMVFRTAGWPALILNAANRYPDGLFDLGMATHNETHYPFSVVSRAAVNAMGFLWDPRIFWGDIFLRDVMAHFGRCEMLPHVQVDHEWAGFPYDVLHHDPVYWSETHPQAVQDAITKLQVLRG